MTDFDRRFSVESPGAVRDSMTAREALQALATAGPTARLLADGLALKAGQLATIEALACRRVSVATLAVGSHSVSTVATAPQESEASGLDSGRVAAPMPAQSTQQAPRPLDTGLQVVATKQMGLFADR